MAKMIRNKRCVKCGAHGVFIWTLDNMNEVAVTYLCLEDSQPLLEIVRIAGGLAPNEQVPVSEREQVPEEPAYVNRGRRGEMVALEWTPPPG